MLLVRLLRPRNIRLLVAEVALQWLPPLLLLGSSPTLGGGVPVARGLPHLLSRLRHPRRSLKERGAPETGDPEDRCAALQEGASAPLLPPEEGWAEQAVSSAREWDVSVSGKW